MQYPMMHLDDAAVLDVLDLPAVTARLDEAYAAWGHARAATTTRVRATSSEGMASAMAAVVPPYSGGKVYATVDGRFTFVIVLFDLSGRVLCTLDGNAVTSLRTPATSALAIRHLAAPSSQVAAVVGGGRQAWGHLEMLAAELPDLAEVRLYARRPEAARGLQERSAGQGLPTVVVAPSAASAVDGADVVVTVTSSPEPLFPATVVSDRALICAVGATKYDRCEIGPDVVERCAAVVADDVTGSRSECGDLLRATAAGRFDWERAVELHDVVAGTAGGAVPRAGSAGPVLFETQGVALQDVATAGLAWERHATETDYPTDTDKEQP